MTTVRIPNSKLVLFVQWCRANNLSLRYLPDRSIDAGERTVPTGIIPRPPRPNTPEAA